MSRPGKDGAGPEKAETVISVGHILKPYGTKGEIKFKPYYPEFLQPEDIPTGFKGLADRGNADNPRETGLPVSVVSVKSYKRLWIFRFEGFDRPEAVMRLTNLDLWIDRADFPTLPEGELLDTDLMGCVVIDEERGELGKITAVIHTGANDIWEVAPKQGEGILIPVLDHVVLSVDIEGERITVRLPEGLVD